MQSSAILLALAGLAGLASAQTTTATTPSTVASTSSSVTTGAPATTGTTLPELVSQLPTCALPCFAKAASEIGCAETDLTCLCSGNHTTQLAEDVALCIGIGGSCDLGTLSTLATNICSDVNANPGAPALASASSAIAAELASISSASAASASASATHNAAAPRRTDMAIGAVGVAAAFAVLAF